MTPTCWRRCGVSSIVRFRCCEALAFILGDLVSFPLPWYAGGGQGGGFRCGVVVDSENESGPHPNPPPEYQGRGKYCATADSERDALL
jgi:hypothetical protein